MGPAGRRGVSKRARGDRRAFHVKIRRADRDSARSRRCRYSKKNVVDPEHILESVGRRRGPPGFRSSPIRRPSADVIWTEDGRTGRARSRAARLRSSRDGPRSISLRRAPALEAFGRRGARRFAGHAPDARRRRGGDRGAALQRRRGQDLRAGERPSRGGRAEGRRAPASDLGFALREALGVAGSADRTDDAASGRRSAGSRSAATAWSPKRLGRRSERDLLVEDTIVLPVQVNPARSAAHRRAARRRQGCRSRPPPWPTRTSSVRMEGTSPRARVIVVPQRIVNLSSP